jgi:hypothetical protein
MSRRGTPSVLSPASGRGETSATIWAAYHDGPPEISFFGYDWRRGVAREVTAEEWRRMQLRGDFKEFDFQSSPLPNPLPQAGEGETVEKE